MLSIFESGREQREREREKQEGERGEGTAAEVEHSILVSPAG